MIPIKDQQRMITVNEIYLLTGAAGFIGSNICRTLLSRPETRMVIGIDNLNSYYSPDIKRYRLSTFNKQRKFIFLEKSILDYSGLQEIIRKYKPTTLIHTAAEVGISSGELHPLEYFSTNVLGSLTVLEASKGSIRHAIMFSSSSVYGDSTHVPYSESKEISLSDPISTYGASKASMEIAVKNFQVRTGLPITIVRPFSVYGPNGRPDMLPQKLLLCAHNNTPITIYSPDMLKRDWTYIDDFVNMFSSVIDKPKMFQILNIGSGIPILLRDVIHTAQMVLREYDLTIQYSVSEAKPHEMKQTWANTSKIKALTDAFPYTNFEFGFKKTAEFFFSHKELYTV